MEQEDKIEKIENEGIFYELQAALQPYQTILKEAIEAVFTQDVSNYPILVAHEIADAEIGLPLISDIANGAWFVRISTLEEFVVKQIITGTKIDDFRKLYKKQSDKKFCLFVIQKESTPTFLFLPKI